MRKTLTCGTLTLVAAAGLTAALAGPAAAATPNCKAVVTTLTDRLDSGLHGDWAKDAIVRTVTFCETTPAAAVAATEVTSAYTATVVDKGTFATVAGKSPVAGITIPAGIKGMLTGGYAATFKAAPNFATFSSKLAPSYAGTAGPKTSEWVKAAWGGSDIVYLSDNLADNKGWTWTYWTCSADLAHATESWTNAAPDVNTGDITKACPSVDPIVLPTASANPTAAPSASASAAPVAALPITGTNVGLIAAGGIVLLAAGAGLTIAGRKRRTTTT